MVSLTNLGDPLIEDSCKLGKTISLWILFLVSDQHTSSGTIRLLHTGG